ncbi:MAG: ATP-binding cassette domain-containing protein [Anaerolineaceae bacterium]|nr:ATP-binding cassette domain-containing protein [Anaerolineaceae bacterium]
MSITLENVSKRYHGHPVVNNVSLEVKDGEFFVLLGSSGSGKTTILSLIAGLNVADSGVIRIAGRDVSALPAQQRRVGYVFQNYALFQNMSVADNIEFGLSVHRVPRADRQHRRDELLEMVGLVGLGGRMPRQLSGGEQQRVALARALAQKPDVLLLDEPLSALDAKIRAELRRTLRAIQRRLGIATIFVTHDQEEAFDLADRIGVMSYGRLVETGTPEQLYQRPETEFVATFLGTANLMVGRATPGGVQVGPLRFPFSSPQVAEERRVQVLFRPEDVVLAPTPEQLEGPRLGAAEVEEVSFAGSFQKLRLHLNAISGIRCIAPPVPFGSRSILIDATRSPDQAQQFPLEVGQWTWVGVRQVHTLAHPGLQFLVAAQPGDPHQAAIDLGGSIARLAHARLLLLGYGPNSPQQKDFLQETRKKLTGMAASVEVNQVELPLSRAVAWAVEKQPCDMIVLPFQSANDIEPLEKVLAAGEHHVLLAPGPCPPPGRVLVCVTGSEPGKEDILFTSRLIRHLSAQATLLTVLPEAHPAQHAVRKAEAFLNNGVHSMAVFGVQADTVVRQGVVQDEILAEWNSGLYDMLVLGTPLSDHEGEVSLDGVVQQVLSAGLDRPVLIVHSRYLPSWAA